MFWIALQRGHTWGQNHDIQLHVLETLEVALHYEVDWLHYHLWPRAAGAFFDREGSQLALLCLLCADSGVPSPPYRTGAVWITFSSVRRQRGHHELDRSFFSLDGDLQYIPLTTTHSPLRLCSLPSLVLPGTADAQGAGYQRWATYSASYIWSCSLLGPPRGSGSMRRPICPF